MANAAQSQSPDPSQTPGPPLRESKRHEQLAARLLGSAYVRPSAWGRRELVRVSLLAVGPLVVLLGAGWLYLFGARFVSTDDAYVKQDKIPISTDVSGRVVEVLVGDQAPVKRGDLLFRLDEEPFRISLQRAEAQLALVRMEVQTSRNLEIARQNAAASRESSAPGLSNFDQFPNRPYTQHPRYMQAQAVRDQAALDLSYTRVVAPATGVVANMSLRAGVYVQAGRPVFAVVATDPLWVEANFKETDLTHVRLGQFATLSVDAFSDHDIRAVVTGINPGTGSEFSLLPPQNASGNWVKVVQRVPVRLEPLEVSPSTPLRAGMSVTVEIDTGFRRPVLGWFGSDKAGAALARPSPPPKQP
jgi:membrane fusion protein (multidrug efflux system)